MFAYLLNFTRQEADTRDLLQELFIKLAQRPELLEGVRDGGANAVLAASIFHFGQWSIADAKMALVNAGIPVRNI